MRELDKIITLRNCCRPVSFPARAASRSLIIRLCKYEDGVLGSVHFHLLSVMYSSYFFHYLILQGIFPHSCGTLGRVWNWPIFGYDMHITLVYHRIESKVAAPEKNVFFVEKIVIISKPIKLNYPFTK